MQSDVVASTFRHDVEEAIRTRFINVAKIEFRAKLSDSWDNYLADAIISPPNGSPMVVFYATTEAKVDEAVLMHYDLREKKQSNFVALVLEQIKPPAISARALRRAHNRLDAIPIFRGDEDAAMDKLAGKSDYRIMQGKAKSPSSKDQPVDSLPISFDDAVKRLWASPPQPKLTKKKIEKEKKG